MTLAFSQNRTTLLTLGVVLVVALAVVVPVLVRLASNVALALVLPLSLDAIIPNVGFFLALRREEFVVAVAVFLLLFFKPSFRERARKSLFLVSLAC